MSDPANPVAAGYIDAAAAISYPQQTLIPAFMNFGVSNSFTNTKAVCFNNNLLISKDSVIRMYRIDNNNLVEIDSFTIGIDSFTIEDSISTRARSGVNSGELLLLSDSLLGIQSAPFFRPIGMSMVSYWYLNFKAAIMSPSGFSLKSVGVSMEIHALGRGGIGSYIFSSQYPYYHCIKQTLFISCDYLSCYVLSGAINIDSTFSNSSRVYNISNNTNAPVSFNMPYANAYNTGHNLSSTEHLCTSGFPLDCFPLNLPFAPGNIATELFVSDVGDPRPYSTASSNNAIYRDTAHKQNQIQNILLDTMAKRIYLIFNNNMTILNYQHQTIGIAGHPGRSLPVAKGLFVLASAISSSVTIVLPSHSALSPADLYFYDLSGRVVDRIPGVISNAVLWWPKTMGCYIVMARVDGERYTKKFMVQ